MIIQISKDGQSVEAYELATIAQGLASGYFSGTDWAWSEGAADWKPLQEVLDELEATHQTQKLQPFPITRTDNIPRLSREPIRRK